MIFDKKKEENLVSFHFNISSIKMLIKIFRWINLKSRLVKWAVTRMVDLRYASYGEGLQRGW